MPRPICFKCRKEMFVVKNEVIVADKGEGNNLRSMWYGDILKCRVCGNKVVFNFGKVFVDSIQPELEFGYE